MTDLMPLVTAAFGCLADLLEPLPEGRWGAPSLCEAWTVRDVVAHVTMAARYDAATFGAELASDGFDFDKLSRRIAARDATLPTAELVADLRSPVLQAFEPPDGGPIGALSHAVIHGADITVPLGLPTAAPDDALVAVLDSLASAGTAGHFGVDARARTWVATDLPWRSTSDVEGGEVVKGTATELVLRLAGRRVEPR